MNAETQTELIHDLANDVPQSQIAEKLDMTQQNVSYYKKKLALEVERVRVKLVNKLSNSMINRAVKESRKADRIVDKYDDDTLNLPTKEQQEYLKQHDNKIGGLVKGILSPQTNDTNINIQKNETVNNINSDVLKMFHQGAKALIDAVD